MMADGLADLTDKEKEALRLLLSGHDAKTSAAELDLSVHTVNDRLRNARRKLGVSSSREAARILGDAEGGAPQNLVHNDIGMAENQPGSDPADLNETRHAAASRTVWLAGGMLIMSMIMAAIVVGVVHTSAEPTSDSMPGAADVQDAETVTVSGPSSPEEMAAAQRAERFLALVDEGLWEASWEDAGAFFQSQSSVEEWAEIIEPVRPPLGEVISREIAQVQRAESLPGMPDGDFTVLAFDTNFENRDTQSVETVIMMQGDSGLEVIGYFIR